MSSVITTPLSIRPESVLKRKPRTRITLLSRHVNGPDGGSFKKFVLKKYHYPFFLRIRTVFSIPKAERSSMSCYILPAWEYLPPNPLLSAWKKPCSIPCALVFLSPFTLAETTNLSSHRKSNKRPRSEISVKYCDIILGQIGERLRRLHQVTFFSFHVMRKNILLRHPSGQSIETLFIDVPYARALRWRPLMQWAQKRDIAMFLGSFLPSPYGCRSFPFL